MCLYQEAGGLFLRRNNADILSQGTDAGAQAGAGKGGARRRRLPRRPPSLKRLAIFGRPCFVCCIVKERPLEISNPPRHAKGTVTFSTNANGDCQIQFYSVPLVFPPLGCHRLGHYSLRQTGKCMQRQGTDAPSVKAQIHANAKVWPCREACTHRQQPQSSAIFVYCFESV